MSELANTTFTYDAQNRPLSETAPGLPAVTFAYDALGRRASRSAGTAAETYSYVGEKVARIDRGGGDVTDSAIDAMGDRLTVGPSWVLPNVRGDVAALLDSQQSATDAYRYDPFGQLLDSFGATANPYRFQGRLLEPTSGQYDFGSRQYDPALAAFTSIDTMLGEAANPISLNRYLYGHANPESMIDPDGHAACKYGGDDCAETSATNELSDLQSQLKTETAAVARALAAAVLADRAAVNAEQAAKNKPRCMLERSECAEWLAGWQKSAQWAAFTARRDADAAWERWRLAVKAANATAKKLAAAQAKLNALKKKNAQTFQPKRSAPASQSTNGPSGMNVLNTVKSGAEYAEAAMNVENGLRVQASALGICLATCNDPVQRAAAAKLLPEAGAATKFVESPVFSSAATKLPVIGAGADYLGRVVAGESGTEAGVRTVVDVAAFTAGSEIALAGCAVVGVATWGVGGLVCAGAAAAGGFVVTHAANTLVDSAKNIDWIFWD